MQLLRCVLSTVFLAGVPHPAFPLDLLLRYDDFSEASSQALEEQLLEVVRETGATILIGVIPFSHHPHPEPTIGPESQPLALSEKKIDLLRRFLALGTAEIAVHGFNHRSTGTDPEVGEFAHLSQTQQVHLLATAKHSLEASIGVPIRAFIPPQNQYNIKVFDALKLTGFELLSAGSSGAIPTKRDLAVLPGGPYPQRIEHIVQQATAWDHTDATIVVTMHPYDFIEAGTTLPTFSNGTKQLSVAEFADMLRRLVSRDGIRFSSVAALLDNPETLSPERFRANHRLAHSRVTRARLLPNTFQRYPLSGLYYSASTASRLHVDQIAATIAMYGALFTAAFGLTVFGLRRIDNGRRRVCVAVFSLALLGLTTILVKSVLTGFYLSAAVCSTVCVGILAAAALSQQSPAIRALSKKLHFCS